MLHLKFLSLYKSIFITFKSKLHNDKILIIISSSSSSEMSRIFPVNFLKVHFIFVMQDILEHIFPMQLVNGQKHIYISGQKSMFTMKISSKTESQI